MSTKFRSQMKEVMQMAWSFVRKNGYSMSEALKCAWANLKLKAALKVKIVEFYFKKTDGTLRQAFGTLKENLIGEVKGRGRKPNDNLQVYWDTEKKSIDVSKSVTLSKLHNYDTNSRKSRSKDIPA